MTYKEAFLQCDSIEEIMEMANTDMAFAAVINSDRIPVIMRAAEEAINEKFGDVDDD